MKKIIPLALALMATTALAADILPETPAKITVSNHDINRIVCPGKMNDLIFSKEKGLVGHFSGNSAFIKFKVMDDNGKYTYASEPCELYAVCQGQVYTLIVTPKNIPAKTIQLAAPVKKSFKQNIAHFKNMPLEKKALRIIKESFNDEYPAGYRIASASRSISISPHFKTKLVQVVSIDGVGLRLKKYQVTNTQASQIRIQETDFLRSQISDSILAVAVEDHTLGKNEKTRVFVVERKEAE